MKRGLVLLAMFATVGSASLPAGAQVRVGPPPPRRHERVPPVPSPEFAWQGGSWAWNGYRYVWRAGHYGRRPYEHAHWVPAQWVHRPTGWVRVEGYWSHL